MLEARQITVHFDERAAISDVSLRVEPGKMTAIIGANGAGKSTLLRALNGSVSVTAGDVALDDRAIGLYSRRSVARAIAVVAQEAELRFPVTVSDFVLGGRYAWSNAWGWENARDIKIAAAVMRETSLEDFAHRMMTELSGGERQRVVVARALATEAKIFLLDEPTANLDLAHQAAMLSLIRARCDRGDTAAVVVTHDLNLAAEFSNQIMLLREGRTVAMGTPRDVLTPDLLQAVFELRVLIDEHPVSGAPRITPVHER
ncbi:MAG TPA: ABC transporter ATP-binding protein [Pyrinomonadaceae bacterium]|jgi:iron complex transport system ATP-binding protein|nr:ABC transporter ATP-binding protein [Pyrinomonadaceae bacterium]